MNYPSSMRLLGSPFYPLTHDLDDLDEYLVGFFLYEDYSYIIEQSLNLLKNINEEIFRSVDSEDTESNSNDSSNSKVELYGLECPEYELEKLLFTIHRKSNIRHLVEARGYPIHSAIRNQVDDISNIPDDILIYLFAAIKASQALTEAVEWMFSVENGLFERQGAGIIEGAGEMLNDTRENFPDVYSTIINEVRSENLKEEISTALYASKLLDEAQRARLLASVYPSLGDAKRLKESIKLIDEKNIKRSAKGGSQFRKEYKWAREYIKSNWPEIAYDDSQMKIPKSKLVKKLINELLPKERDRLSQLLDPEGISRHIPGEKALGGNGPGKPGWLVKFGYNDLPLYFP
ncbi:hypothetical protein ACM25P_13080 [Vreelandella alkaliphila]|uniref:hypothetical protein n=1 Tax=Vreelandella alkaliphila TaxID=272774 RepID=UPI0039F479AD